MKTRRPPSMRQLQTIVDKFNLAFPPGTKVILRKDSGEVETTVTNRAQILSGHSAVGWFEGVSGAYSIEDGRVRAVGEAKPNQNPYDSGHHAASEGNDEADNPHKKRSQAYRDWLSGWQDYHTENAPDE